MGGERQVLNHLYHPIRLRHHLLKRISSYGSQNRVPTRLPPNKTIINCFARSPSFQGRSVGREYSVQGKGCGKWEIHPWEGAQDAGLPSKEGAWDAGYHSCKKFYNLDSWFTPKNPNRESRIKTIRKKTIFEEILQIINQVQTHS